MKVRLCLIILISCIFSACTKEDSNYYRFNPERLNTALQKCPEKSPKQVSCPELKSIALELNQLAWELQQNPQAFGQKMMALQTEQMRLNESNASSHERDVLQREIAIRLAVIRWLESPER